MMVGYALDHPGDTNWMWDRRTKNVHITHYVIWLRRMYYDPGVVPEEIGENQTVIDANLPTAEAGEGNGNDGLDDAIAADTTTDEDNTADADVEAKIEAEIDDGTEVTSRSGAKKGQTTTKVDRRDGSAHGDAQLLCRGRQ
jgi:hypothetical protein